MAGPTGPCATPLTSYTQLDCRVTESHNMYVAESHDTGVSLYCNDFGDTKKHLSVITPYPIRTTFDTHTRIKWRNVSEEIFENFQFRGHLPPKTF